MVLEGVTYLVTRRTSQRFFRFPPCDDVVKQIFLFALAYAAFRTGVRVHGWILMSNHFHIVMTDVQGKAPLFHQYLDQTIANLLKRHFPEIDEGVWNSSQISVVDLSNDIKPCDVTVMEKLVYTMGNAKISGLVAKWTQWEGSMSKPEDMGERVVQVKRPACASKRTKLPARMELRVEMPPSLEGWDRAEVVATLHRELQAIPRPERPVGMRRIRQQSIWDRPGTKAKRTGINPRVAGRGDRRKTMLSLLKSFGEAYASALEKYCAGKPCVFPEGTWKMRVLFGVKVEGRADPPAEAA